MPNLFDISSDFISRYKIYNGVLFDTASIVSRRLTVKPTVFFFAGSSRSHGQRVRSGEIRRQVRALLSGAPAVVQERVQPYERATRLRADSRHRPDDPQ